MMRRNHLRSPQYPTRPNDTQLAFAGEIGEPITVTGTITRRGKVLGSFYSTVSTLLEIDCGTSIVTIFSTARWAEATQFGEQVTATGTVKKHQHWRGIPQTLLGWTARIDTQADPPATDPPDLDVWPAGKTTIRRRFPDHPNQAAPPDLPPTTTTDRSRP